MSDGNATEPWPLAIDRCEDNYVVVPWVAEFFSTLSALPIILCGLLPLFTSTYSDDLLDVASALVVLNGVTSALSHATLLRVVGRADELSIYLGTLLYLKALVLAHSPHIHVEPVKSAPHPPPPCSRRTPPPPGRFAAPVRCATRPPLSPTPHTRRRLAGARSSTSPSAWRCSSPSRGMRAPCRRTRASR